MNKPTILFAATTAALGTIHATLGNLLAGSALWVGAVAIVLLSTMTERWRTRTWRQNIKARDVRFSDSFPSIPRVASTMPHDESVAQVQLDPGARWRKELCERQATNL